MTQFKYNLRSGSKKETCPECGKKTFVPYIENETGNEIPTDGRCDREQNCGYHKKPEHNEPISKPKFEQPKKQTDYISLTSMERYFCDYSNNNFCDFLQTKFELGKVMLATYDYFLSSKDNQVIFWQIDSSERIRSGKVMDYNPITGKRVKDDQGKSAIN